MKIKKGFILRDMGEYSVVIASGETLKKYNCMITLNQSGKLLWKTLETGADFDQLLKTMLDEYEVDENTAKEHIQAFINKLQGAEILENS